jgi:hypothetical protein
VSERLKPADMPHWPRRMRAQLAAAYMDEPLSSFYAKYGALGMDRPGGRRWYKEDLDRALDAEKAGGSADADPYMEGLRDAS